MLDVSRWKPFFQTLRTPERTEKRTALNAIWASLPESLRTSDQVLGRHGTGCAATYGIMEACNFNCTACYLSDEANQVPPLPLPEIKAQLRQIRAHLGPWGNTQLTAGEVTLLPVEDLIELVQYCRELELSPMLMTNGQVLLKDPNYLERLVVEGGLQKVAIHIDTTQKGRLGLKANDREQDIHWIRDAFARLIRETRHRTGKTLHAAHTFTVTENNFQDVPEVLAWMLRNADAFRMLSLQPTAAVGRTRTNSQTDRRQALWSQIRAGLGTNINHQPFKFGHPDCNSVSLSFAIAFRNADGTEEHHVMDVAREGEAHDTAFLQGLLQDGFGGFSPNGEDTSQLLAEIVGRLIRQPRFLMDIPAYALGRLAQERAWLPRLARAAISRRPFFVKPLVVVVHDFMSADQLDTPEGQARLQACSFRVPVEDKMVPMCELNGTELRTQMNRVDRERLRVIS
ncbi:MAG: radical SAM protein [Myxococcales bacterium]|nr:radical SAM protein [Myxococcales bacterium]